MAREVTVTIETTSAGITVDPGDTRVVRLYRDGDPVPATNGIPAGGTTGQVLSKASNADYDAQWTAAGSGSGDVVGPASAVSGRIAVFNGTTGKLIADGGAAIAELATSAQGALADSAVQPGDLATVATTGAYSDLSGLPTLGTAAAANTGDFATAAQGALADTATQPADLAGAISTHSAATDPHGDRAYADSLAANYDAAGTAASAVSTHAALTATHGVTGDLVGTTDTQTLTGKTISGSSNTLTVLSSQVDSVFVDVTTTHTAAAADDGKIYRLLDAATVTIPDSLSAGWTVGWVQVGSGQSTFAVSGSMVLRNRQSHTKSAGQWAAGSLLVQAANSVVLGGDTGT